MNKAPHFQGRPRSLPVGSAPGTQSQDGLCQDSCWSRLRELLHGTAGPRPRSCGVRVKLGPSPRPGSLRPRSPRPQVPEGPGSGPGARRRGAQPDGARRCLPRLRTCSDSPVLLARHRECGTALAPRGQSGPRGSQRGSCVAPRSGRAMLESSTRSCRARPLRANREINPSPPEFPARESQVYNHPLSRAARLPRGSAAARSAAHTALAAPNRASLPRLRTAPAAEGAFCALTVSGGHTDTREHQTEKPPAPRSELEKEPQADGPVGFGDARPEGPPGSTAHRAGPWPAALLCPSVRPWKATAAFYRKEFYVVISYFTIVVA